MTLVELYSKEGCHLCDDARAVLERVRKQVPFTLREFKLTPDDANFEEYKEMFPVVCINKVPAFKYRVKESILRIRLLQVADPARVSGVDPDEPPAQR